MESNSNQYSDKLNAVKFMKTLKSNLSLLALGAALATGALPVQAKEASPELNLARSLNKAFIEVADTVSESVVVIRVAHKPEARETVGEGNPLFEMLPPEWRRRFQEEQEDPQPRRSPRNSDEPQFNGQGSGVIIREDGYIMTNRHVVDGAEKIKVRLHNGQEYDAEVRGTDAQSDIAIIKVEGKGLPAAKLGDSAKVRVGEFAIAIGAPFDLDYSVTFGHVSAKGRSRVIPDPSMDQDFIQTDANINPGNSGGPLVNIDGEVIGINTLIRGMNTGIGFAVPINLAKDVSEGLIRDGRYARSWLGVSIRALADDPDYKAITDAKDGVVVYNLAPDGPAAKSDLKPADIIVTVDGVPVKSAQELKNEIRTKKIGAPVTLDVVRNNKKMKIKVNTGEWPDETIPVAARRQPTETATNRDFGLTVKTLTKDLASEYEVDASEGVIVTAVDAEGAAARRGIRPGDVITEVNQKPVTTVKEFRDALKDAPKKGVVVNLISRGVNKFEILKDSGD